MGTNSAGNLRVEINPYPQAGAQDSPIVVLDGNRGELWSEASEIQGKALLTMLESRLAWFLLFNVGIIHSYQDIMEHVWEYPRGTPSQVVYTGLSRLAKKSADVGLERWWRARHGFGYWVDGVLLSHDV